MILTTVNRTWRWYACAETCRLRQQRHRLEIVSYYQRMQWILSIVIYATECSKTWVFTRACCCHVSEARLITFTRRTLFQFVYDSTRIYCKSPEWPFHSTVPTEMLYILWSSCFSSLIFRVHKSQSLVGILNHINLLYTVRRHFFKINLMQSFTIFF